MTTETCSNCKGSGFVTGFVCPGFEEREIKCANCDGTGQITDLRRRWMAIGKELRIFRRIRDMGQMEAAKWLGISVVEWSKAEHGQVDPSTVYIAAMKKDGAK